MRFSDMLAKAKSKYNEAKHNMDEREQLALARTQNAAQRARIKADTQIRRQKAKQEIYNAEAAIKKAKAATTAARKAAGHLTFGERMTAVNSRVNRYAKKQRGKR